MQLSGTNHGKLTKPLAETRCDEDQLANIFAQTMKMADFKTQTSADIRKEIEALTNLNPAVIILDL
jgi:DNA-binding response OmpR family regulator